MKQKTIFKSIFSVLLVSALVLLGVVVSRGNAIASETTTDTCSEAVWELYSAETPNKYADYREKGTNGYTAPTKENLVFAGWYNEENGTPLSEEAANAAVEAYAKFVPAHILTVKAQITEAWTYGQTEAANKALETPVTSAAIRLITTVDTLKYQNVGFEMTIGEDTYDSIEINAANGNDTHNIVYSRLYAVGEQGGEQIPFYPSSFCSMSTRFKTFTFTGIPVSDFNDYISAKAYWTTVDGTQVFGKESVKTVNLGRANGKALTESETFVNPFEALREDNVGENSALPYNLFYETLEKALKGTNGEDLTSATIEMIKDVDVNAQITVGSDLTDCTDIKITNCITTLPVKSVAEKITLTKAVGFDTANGKNMFEIVSGYKLAIEGGNTETKTGITIDGNSVDTEETLIVNKGTFGVKNVTVKNALVLENSTNTSVLGGAIRSTGKELNVDNCLFDMNASNNNGGAIYVSGTTNTITNTIFTNNRSRANSGGALACSGGTTQVTGCTFDGNWLGDAQGNNNAGTGKSGGAIYVNNANAVLTLSNSTLKNNNAKDGGAIRATFGTIHINGCTFETNHACKITYSTTDSEGNPTTATTSGNGGAIYADGATTLKLNEDGSAPNTFKANTSAAAAGAIGYNGSTSVILGENSFIGNTATSQGGAINANAGTLKVNDCTFTGNTANTDGGAIRCANTMEINSCTFDSNKSNTKGGAIYLTGSGVLQKSTGNIFTKNTTSGSGTNGLGGALYVASGTCTVGGWTFEDNSATTSGNDIAVAAGKSINLSDSTFDNSEVTLMMSGASAGVANISGELKDVTFRYYGYDGTSTISSGITVSATDIAATSDIKIIPYTYEEGTPVVFGSVSQLTDDERERFGATSKGDGKHFGVDQDGKLAYTAVAKIGDTEYATLHEALAATTSMEETDVTVTLLRDSEYSSESRAEICKNVTIQNVEDRTVTIFKSSSIDVANIMKANDGYELKIQSVGGNKVIIDGRCAEEAVDGTTAADTSSALLYTIAGTITLDGVTAQYANSTGNGGIIQVNGAGTANLTDCTFVSNKASTGGAIAVNDASGTASISNSSFIDNTAASNGGAIYTVGVATSVTDCNFTSNKAGNPSNGNGGAIYATSEAKVTVSVSENGSSTFNGNTAYRVSEGKLNLQTYGAICANGTSYVEYSGKCSFVNNTDGDVTSTTDVNEGFATGIGIGRGTTTSTIVKTEEVTSYETLKSSVESASTLHQTKITLLNDIVIGDTRIDAATSGKDVVITNASGMPVKITRGSDTNSNLFAVGLESTLSFVTNTENSGSLTIDGTWDKQKSAMLYVKDGGTLVLNGVTVTGANAGDGAAIKVVKGTADIDNCVFTNLAAANGGAISLNAANGEVSCTIDNSTFNANTALYAGGAIYISSTNKVTCTISNSTFIGNNASTHGGAIYAENSNAESVTYLLGNVNFSQNSATNGGAIYVKVGTMTTESADSTVASGIVNFSSNTAESGGAIYQQGGTVTLLGGGTASNNSATGGQGGAFNANAGTSLSVANYTFTGNTSKTDGGAIRGCVDVYITNCNFSDNHASSNHTAGAGGAIYMTGSKTLTLAGEGSFNGNTAYTNGNAISYNATPVNKGTYTFSETDYIYDRNAQQNVAL